MNGSDKFVMKFENVYFINGTAYAGKSTIVNLIPRFYDVTKGCVKINGQDVREYPLASLRERIGVVLQKAVLFKGSIRDNMRWGNANATDEEIRKALEAAQALGFVEEKEGGLDFVVAQGGKNFSGGQRQRLSIARALVRKPEILILDDSTSALDYVTDARLRKELKNRKNTMTTFIVSQRTSSIQFADKIVVLEDGKMVGLGTHKYLLDHCEVYQEIYASQYQSQEEEEEAYE